MGGGTLGMIVATCAMAFVIPKADYGFYFDFTDLVIQIGDEGYKSSGDFAYSVKVTEGFADTEQFITVYVGKPTGERIREYVSLHSKDTEMTGQYLVDGVDYSGYEGRVHLSDIPVKPELGQWERLFHNSKLYHTCFAVNAISWAELPVTISQPTSCQLV